LNEPAGIHTAHPPRRIGAIPGFLPIVRLSAFFRKYSCGAAVSFFGSTTCRKKMNRHCSRQLTGTTRNLQKAKPTIAYAIQAFSSFLYLPR
jgi:hypothetical protein